MPRLVIAILLAPWAGALANSLFALPRTFSHQYNSVSQSAIGLLFGVVVLAVIWYALLIMVLLPINFAFRKMRIGKLVAYQISFGCLGPLVWNVIFPIPRSFGELGVGANISDWLEFVLAAVITASVFWFIAVKPRAAAGQNGANAL
jgi:riboflavin transporter FmnP